MVRLASFLSFAARAVDRAVAAAVVIILVAMLTVTSAGVFWRYALNSALSWSEELGRYLLVWVSFLGAAMAAYRGAHIGINAFVSLLPTTLRYRLSVAVDFAVILFMVSILKSGLEILSQVSIRIAPTLGISMQIPYLVVPFSAGVIILNMLAKVTNDIVSGQGNK